MHPFHTLLAQLAKGMAWISGMLFLLLAFYMTGDALSRTLGGPFTGVSDQIAAFCLSLGATWALAQGVVSGTHVRSDVLLPLLPAPVKRWFGVLALAGLTVFAWMLAYSSFLLTMESHDMGSTVPQSIIDMQLYIPQAVSTFGFIVFAITALVSTLVAAGNGSYTDGERRALAVKLREIRNQMMSIVNRADGGGGYVFGGQGASSPPFVDTPTGVTFRGQGGEILASSSERLALTVDGEQTWLMARTGNGVFTTGPDGNLGGGGNQGTAWIGSGSITDPATLPYPAATPPGPSYTIEFTDTGSGITYDVLEDGNPIASGEPYANGKTIDIPGRGMSVTISGVPANGDTFRIGESESSLSIFDSLDRTIAALSSQNATGGVVKQAVNTGMTEIDSVLSNVQSARSAVGESLNRMEGIESRIGAQQRDGVAGDADIGAAKAAAKVAVFKHTARHADVGHQREVVLHRLLRRAEVDAAHHRRAHARRSRSAGGRAAHIAGRGDTGDGAGRWRGQANLVAGAGRERGQGERAEQVLACGVGGGGAQHRATGVQQLQRDAGHRRVGCGEGAAAVVRIEVHRAADLLRGRCLGEQVVDGRAVATGERDAGDLRHRLCATGRAAATAGPGQRRGAVGQPGRRGAVAAGDGVAGAGRHTREAEVAVGVGVHREVHRVAADVVAGQREGLHQVDGAARAGGAVQGATRATQRAIAHMQEEAAAARGDRQRPRMGCSHLQQQQRSKTGPRQLAGHALRHQGIEAV